MVCSSTSLVYQFCKLTAAFLGHLHHKAGPHALPLRPVCLQTPCGPRGSAATNLSTEKTKKTRYKGDISPPGIQLRLSEHDSDRMLQVQVQSVCWLPPFLTATLTAVCSSKVRPWENSGLSSKGNANYTDCHFPHHTRSKHKAPGSKRLSCCDREGLDFPESVPLSGLEAYLW